MCHAGVVPLTCFSTKQICLLQKKGGKESKMEAMTWGEGEGWHRKQFITSGEDGLGWGMFPRQAGRLEFRSFQSMSGPIGCGVYL